MPSFDITSEMNWQELDNAVQQAQKEIQSRFDFKGVNVEIKVDQKQNSMVMTVSTGEKADAAMDVLENKMIKRGLSLLSFSFKKDEAALGKSLRKIYEIQASISKEKGKEIIKALKDTKMKIQAQIQDEQVRVTGKSRDDLQEAIAFLKSKQEEFKLPMQFGNFRD